VTDIFFLNIIISLSDSVRYVVISFTKRANAERCRAALNGIMLDGFPILVSWYQPSLLDRVLAPKSPSFITIGSNRGYISNTLWNVHTEGDTYQSTTSSISPRGVNNNAHSTSGENTAKSEPIQSSPRSSADSSLGVTSPGTSEKKLGGLGSATSIYIKFESFVKVRCFSSPYKSTLSNALCICAFLPQSIAINEAVFHEIFSQFGTITEVTLKKLLTDQVKITFEC
jgi:RNA recognition motif-containing protein